jgi:hypothetical protein
VPIHQSLATTSAIPARVLRGEVAVRGSTSYSTTPTERPGLPGLPKLMILHLPLHLGRVRFLETAPVGEAPTYPVTSIFNGP